MDKKTMDLLAYAYTLSAKVRNEFMDVMRDSMNKGETVSEFNKRVAEFKKTHKPM